ncbi:MAG: hypothetical protein V1858_01025 [Candidatus Gottesmanbacteria bacterium]
MAYTGLERIIEIATSPLNFVVRELNKVNMTTEEMITTQKNADMMKRFNVGNEVEIEDKQTDARNA